MLFIALNEGEESVLDFLFSEAIRGAGRSRAGSDSDIYSVEKSTRTSIIKVNNRSSCYHYIYFTFLPCFCLACIALRLTLLHRGYGAVVVRS